MNRCELYLSEISGKFIKYEDILATSHTPQLCGVWLVTGMSSYLINLPKILDRYNAFDITYNLVERNLIIQKVESLFTQFSTEDQMKKIACTDFLIHVLTNDLERSEYFSHLHLNEFEEISSLLQIFSNHQCLI